MYIVIIEMFLRYTSTVRKMEKDKMDNDIWLCRTCDHMAFRPISGLMYCEEKHIECALKKDGSYCSKYDPRVKKEEKEEEHEYEVRLLATGTAVINVTAKNEEEAKNKAMDLVCDADVDDFEFKVTDVDEV